MNRWIFCLTLIAFLGIVLCEFARANPRTQRAACDAVIPHSANSIAPHRYNVYFPRSMDGLLRFYRQVFGSNDPNYRVIKLFYLPQVIAYHIKNMNSRSKWAGINLVYYKQKGQLQIYVLCR
jgi:hypothetical protein